MALSAGQRLGPYEVVSALGAGGMGEVYRAHDAKLKRDVALKILPANVSGDPERLARFEREARVLAALNHPHIAAIYGVEETDGVRALVLELVEGPTLAERLRLGVFPMRDALAIARQITEALEVAHEKGVVHRDLKPANIKVTPDGIVKVLDFGIAKMRAMDDTAPEAPTVTTVGTRPQTVLGTAAYMSPEQARGQSVDKRTDIWAFGCVLYEMLTGRRAFGGATLSDTIAAILEHEPDSTQLPADTAGGVRRLLRRCLEKDPKQRLRDIGDARLELQEAIGGVLDPASRSPSGRRGDTGLWFAAGLALTAVTAGVAGWALKPTDHRAITRLSHVLPEDVRFANLARSLVAIAPDGSSIVYVANRQLHRRVISELNAVPIRGTEGVPSAPFLSPDGQAVGYWDEAAGELRRIGLAGGTAVALTRATALSGASWGRDDAIVYGQNDGIWRISANGGTAEQLVQIKEGELLYGPRMLPDGEAVLFSLGRRASMKGQSTAWDSADIVVQSLQTGERRQILHGSDARVVSTGHLVYALDANLFAIPFDVAKRAVRGAPVPIVEGIQRGVLGSGGQGGAANYDVSEQGTLVYVPTLTQAWGVPRRLLLVDRNGNAEPLIDEQRDYWRPRISPDGRRVAVEVLTRGSIRIWIVDLERRTSSPLTVEGAESSYPVWSSDGGSVVYRSNHGGVAGIYRQAADGSSAAQLLIEWPAFTIRPTDVSRHGFLAFVVGSPQADIRTVPLNGGAASDFLTTSAREHKASFSPDTKWLAYTSNESGQDEVYVRPFPGPAGAGRLVSIGGGADPVWAPDGSALYYRGASGDLMSVPTTLASGFTAARPQPLFRFAGVYRTSGTATAYDIHPDGKRFIMVSPAEVPVDARAGQHLNVVINWFEELKRLAPTR